MRLLKKDNEIIRVIKEKERDALIIDCVKCTMPKKISLSELEGFVECDAEELYMKTDVNNVDVESLDARSRREAYNRYTMIAGILPYLENERQRSDVIAEIAKEWNVSKQTVRHYLCMYLIYQSVGVLASKRIVVERTLTQDERNMQWALNKYYYTKNRNSLAEAYQYMLQHKYRDEEGRLLNDYPSIHQFRYFFRKTRKEEKYIISREGLTCYQRDYRPLVGGGVPAYVSAVGVGMLDSTVADVFLVDSSGNLVGRPTVTVCIDAFSGYCMGYALTWEGGMYSLRSLMLNIIADKVKWCERFGVVIEREQWNCSQLPGTFLTDMGREYTSYAFEQITELGPKVTNLPPFRPDLKSKVERFFGLLNSTYVPLLRGRGTIESDYQERGAHDYRFDARLTIDEFETILIRCILHLNNYRLIENFPYTEQMLQEQVKPYSTAIWNWGIQQLGANLISVGQDELVFTLLPRTQGTFSREGLKVNRLRYHREGFTEQYLKGGTAVVAYNPDDVTSVWLVDEGKYLEFSIIEFRYSGKDLQTVHTQKQQQKALVRDCVSESLQAQIELAEHIETIANSAKRYTDVHIKDVRKNRDKEKQSRHIDFMKEGTRSEKSK